MQKPLPLTINTPGDRDVVLTREFDAPRDLVWQAITTPALIRRWLLGPPGWIMTVCELEPKVGSGYRYEWKKDSGEVIGMGGSITEVAPGRRLVATERFDEAWYPGESVVTQELSDHGQGTLLTMTMRYASAEAREAVLKSGAVSGMEMGYARLEEILSELARGGQ
jgi:uncharacterized protein YndB with AHSA1/START domain